MIYNTVNPVLLYKVGVQVGGLTDMGGLALCLDLGKYFRENSNVPC